MNNEKQTKTKGKQSKMQAGIKGKGIKRSRKEQLNAVISRTAATALALTFLTAGASCFTDGTEIVNTEAVTALVTMGILSGRPDNTFDPKGETRRSELAKMVSLLLDPGAADSGRYTGGHFTDTPGTWAEPYIEHCYETGLITGNGDGTFAPNRTVTGTEAAKILLAASGRDAAGFTGTGWAERVNQAAEAAGLYTDFTANPAAPLTRDNAALLLYNYLTLMPSGRTAIDTLDKACRPQGVTLMEDGSMLLTDVFNRVIWRVSDGKLTLYAGRVTASGLHNQPSGGYHDGVSEYSTFKRPWAAAPFLGGWAVSDAENNALRLVKDGQVRTMNAYTGTAANPIKFAYPTGLAAGDDGYLYVSDTHNGIIWKINTDGLATKAAEKLNDPMGICWKNGTLYIAETGANRIVKLVRGKVSEVAGSGEDGYADGAVGAAKFSLPQGVAADSDGTIYVADTGNSTVRRIRNGMVETFYARDETESEALYPVSPTCVAVSGGRVYITDSFAGKVVMLGV